MIEDFDDQSNENLIRTPSVPAEKAGIRADKWLAEATNLSRSRLAALIEQECVCQNGIPLSAADKKVTAGLRPPYPKRKRFRWISCTKTPIFWC